MDHETQQHEFDVVLRWNDQTVTLMDQPVTWAEIQEQVEHMQRVAPAAAGNANLYYEDEEGDRIQLTNDIGLAEAMRWTRDMGYHELVIRPMYAVESDDESWDKLDAPASPTHSSTSSSAAPPLSVGPPAAAAAAAPAANWESASEDDEDEEDDDVQGQLLKQEEELGSEDDRQVEAAAPRLASPPPPPRTPSPPSTTSTSQADDDHYAEIFVAADDHNDDQDNQDDDQEEEDWPVPSSSSAALAIADADLQERIEQLVDKLTSLSVTSTSDEEDSLQQLLLQLASNPSIVFLLANALSDPAARQVVNSVSAAELSSAGAGVRMAKLKILSRFAPLCAQLVAVEPKFEQLLLRVLSPSAAAPPPASAPSAPVSSSSLLTEHTRVFCDGCQESEAAAGASVSQGFRHARSRYILGPRYKSATKVDFDLCQLCEDSGRFQQSHGPFLKLRTLAECPEIILCVPKGAQGLSLATHLDLSQQQPGLAKEMAEFVDFHRQRSGSSSSSSSSSTTGATASSSAARPPAPVLVASPPKKQQCKHPLKAFETQHAGYHCDGCGLRVMPRSVLHGCRQCNFDLCEDCCSRSASASQAPVAVAPPLPRPQAPVVTAVPPPPPPPAPAAPVMPQAKFVCDCTLADGSIVRPGEQLEKTWRIRNVGEEPWPAGTRLMHVGGDGMGGPRLGKELPSNVMPGDCINVSVELVMPSLPGRYTSYWRLTTPTPTSAKFGHRFWVTVNVVPPPSAPSSPPLPPSALGAFDFERQEEQYADDVDDEFALAVARIVDFGFTDMDQIVTILRQENGDAGRTIDRLLGGDQ